MFTTLPVAILIEDLESHLKFLKELLGNISY